jgi:hypothetical protein
VLNGIILRLLPHRWLMVVAAPTISIYQQQTDMCGVLKSVPPSAIGCRMNFHPLSGSGFAAHAEAAADIPDRESRQNEVREAGRIYQDLLDGRIGRERAVKELKALVKRQKGGWFGKS